MEERVEVLREGKVHEIPAGCLSWRRQPGFFSGVKFDLVFLTKSRKTPNVSLGAGVDLASPGFVCWNANLNFAWWIQAMV